MMREKNARCASQHQLEDIRINKFTAKQGEKGEKTILVAVKMRRFGCGCKLLHQTG